MILHEMIDESGYSMGAGSIYDRPHLREDWQRKFFFFPRRTIRGKWRMGYLYEQIIWARQDPPRTKVYATKKEYFIWKMKYCG